MLSTRGVPPALAVPATAWQLLASFIVVLLVGLAVVTPVHAQSQAINGTIEGSVLDDSGGVLPGVTVTVVNTDTGTQRVVVTNESGVFRAPLLPLGSYRVSAELAGFKKFEQIGITLGAGQTRVINITLGVGAMTEVVSVSADAPVVDTGKVEQGRTLNEREIKELPLTSRNPYNFALLQPGVTGFETQEFGVPRLTANGALLRVNYQIDGNNNTQKDRAGLRQMPMSEVMIREVKVVTSGYAPEFGQTMGLVYNAVTPSGSNRYKGQASYRFQRKAFAAFPFYFQGARTDERKPKTEVDVFTVDVGGPILRDRAFFFGGFENTKRDLSGGRIITITPANAARLGLNEPGALPSELDTKFGIGKVDFQVNSANRLTARYIYFDNFITNNIDGGLNSVQRGTDFSDTQHSSAAQLVTTIGANVLNEFRVQYATREQGRVPGSLAGTGPAITVSTAANFGGPIGGSSDAGFAFQQNVFQVINNLTYLRASHQYKVGFDIQKVDDERTQTQFQLYTFPTIDAYLAARDGSNPKSYASFQQFFGNPNLEYDSMLYGFFVQDDWRITPDFKLLYGVRYDRYSVPDANADAPYADSRSFNVDKNNWGPRAGIVWTLGADKRNVVRANSGLMFDQALLAIYERALQEDGSTTRVTVNVQPASAGSPNFPDTLDNQPPGFTPPRQSISTVDPDFQVARMWQSNVQFERALSENYAVGVGFIYTKGWDLPVITNINPINPGSTLSDGVPVFSTAVNASTRLDPTFNNINRVESIGESTYKAMTLQLTRRFAAGLQFDFSYTLGKSEDNAPITSVLSVQGDAGRVDPTNLDRDKGPNILDQRHTFIGSVVATPVFEFENDILRALASHNTFGIAMQFASGIPVNLRSNRELNNDGVSSDRPVGVSRNSLNLPERYNVDFKYSRVIPIRGTVQAEVVAEFKNIFNTVQAAAVNATIATDLLGVPLAALPTSGDDLPKTRGYEQRQFQLGFRLRF